MHKINQMDINQWSNEYEGEPFHALLCDAPYHLTTITKRFGGEGSAPAKFGNDGAFQRLGKGFMGQEWDGGDVAFRPETWYGMLKHLHAGGFGMAFGGSRTAHRMACAIEDAGFIIHPSIYWVYGSGFPKATSISRAMDSNSLYGKTDTMSKRKADYVNTSGEEIEVVQGNAGFAKDVKKRKRKSGVIAQTELGKAWAGHRYGLQALKPAAEPIIVFQKPYPKKIKPVESMAQTGAGAINIDGSRLPLKNGEGYTINRYDDGMKPFGEGAGHKYTGLHTGSGKGKTGEVYGWAETERDGEEWRGSPNGRWPANLVISDTVSDKFDSPEFFYNVDTTLENADPFIYNKKVAKKERNAGVGNNDHPTLKAISLTQHLATLLLPPDLYAPRRILVPFSGSGSEMIGALLAGWEYVEGVEMTPHYVDIAEKRISHWVVS